MNDEYEEEEVDYRTYYDTQDDVIELLRDYLYTSKTELLKKVRDAFDGVEYY